MSGVGEGRRVRLGGGGGEEEHPAGVLLVFFGKEKKNLRVNRDSNPRLLNQNHNLNHRATQIFPLYSILHCLRVKKVQARI